MSFQSETRFRFHRMLASIALGAMAFTPSARANTNALAAVAAIDPVFEPGLTTLKQTSGIVEHPADHSGLQWAPNLQMLIGMKASQDSNLTVFFVELTTVRPPTNTAGRPWCPQFRTNRFDWSGTNSARRTFEYVSALYPVRVRVFDPAGKKLKEGETTMPWDLLTNSLAETCRASLSLEPGGQSSRPPENDEFVRPFLGGMLSLVTVFASIQSTPALGDVCEKARCAVRLPGLWFMAKSVVGGSLVVSLEPRFKEVSLVEAGQSGADAAYYRLTVDMKSEKRILTTIEIIVGPTGGAGVLLAGMQSIRAVHPAKKNHIFSAQVLAVGTSREGSEGSEVRTGPPMHNQHAGTVPGE